MKMRLVTKKKGKQKQKTVIGASLSPVMHCGIMTSLTLNWAFSLVVGFISQAERLFPVTCIALIFCFKLP